ncbi:MAG: DUF4127 family protein [Anaerovibrio sp.]|uniref:DUF4127 family protein n=1 Tax=Anaerovibrio sp. TaxID=1872532 RepID=UPI0025EA4C0D|nr:DUF4127 family protein [Anaerovibrio sp.]MCR5175324.1 DUF4127 family protein [Anaerovibrio sp.]
MIEKSGIFVFIICFAFLFFVSGNTAEAKGTILFVPHDNRPTSCEQSAEAPELAGYKVLMPPKEILGGLRNTGKIDELWKWVDDNIKSADAAVVSTDTLIYGGLVASRNHAMSARELKKRVERISDLRKRNSDIKLFAFTSLMRTPKNGAAAGAEEPAYYQEYGDKIFRASALGDKADTGKLTPPEKNELELLVDQIPREVWSDYFGRRKTNLNVTKKLIDFVKKDKLDFLLIGKDDNAPLCATHMEARSLNEYAKGLSKDKFMIATGIDEFSMLLLARSINTMTGKSPKVYVQFNFGVGADTVPAFSDEKIYDSVSDELKIAGAKETLFPSAADLILLVNTDPYGRTTDGQPDLNDPEPMFNTTTARTGTREFLEIVKYHIANSNNVSVADIAFANGSDNALMHQLKENGLLFRLCSYSGWNTPTNSTGFALGQGLAAIDLKQNDKNRLLIRRYLDDWGYQSNIRAELMNKLPGSKYYFDLADYEHTAQEFTAKELRSFARNNLSEYPDLNELEFYFPWHLPFIGGIKIPEAEFLNDNIKFYGRWHKEMQQAVCGQGAVYIKAEFTGSSIAAKMVDNNCWWRYTIDDKEYGRIKFNKEQILLADDLSAGKHIIKLVRSTEGEAGLSIFKGFVLDKSGELLEMDEPKRLKLEFVGDSILAGAFNDGAIHIDSYYDTEDNDMAFGPQLARMLKADYSVLGKSGEGVFHNYSESWPGYEVHTADRYPWTYYSFNGEATHVMWNFTDNPSDAVIISIGTNDFIESQQPAEKDFSAAYENLLQVVRRNNPEAVIICVEPVPVKIGPMAGQWTEKVVNKLKNNGDKALFYIHLNEDEPLLDDDDYVGDGIHPTKEGSRKVAKYLYKRVKRILDASGKGYSKVNS